MTITKQYHHLHGLLPSKPCLMDTTNKTPTLSSWLFNGIGETPPNVRVALIEAAAAQTNLASFPSNYGTLDNRFTKQDSELE